MTNKSVDLAVGFVITASVFLALGMWIGEYRAEAALAARCLPQEGERLTATIQEPGSVTCVFAQFPMRARGTRRAT